MFIRLDNQLEGVDFRSGQGRTRVYGEAYHCTPQPETRGERRPGLKDAPSRWLSAAVIGIDAHILQ